MTAFFKHIFSPTIPIEVDYAFESRFILSYRVALFLALTIGILDVMLFLYFPPLVGLITLFCFGVLIYAIVYIRKTGKFYIPMFLINVCGLLACQVTLFFATDQPHLVDPLWMIVNVLLTFLILGEKFGILLSILHSVALFLFFVFFLEEQLLIVQALTPAQIFSIAVSGFLSFSVITYLSWQNIVTNKFAQEKLNLAQHELQNQYNIISKQNEEKTVMVKEIHHRVKNNLQIITSLLRLQARELESPEAIAKFKDATHRVIAMSMIHEKMYQSDHLSKMHLREYLKELSQDLLSSYQSGYEVQLEIECNVESVGLKSIVPLALILNELISNSLKYAFDEYESCFIKINFESIGNRRSLLTYSDSGTWKAPSRQGSFGLDLIESLTDQLDGTMQMETQPVTKFIFDIMPSMD